MEDNSAISPIDWTEEAKDFNLEEEIQDGWTVTTKDKKIWCVELNLTKRFLEVCKKHNLTCVAGGGTMLGAIRHNGFIPWDNDIDFFMPREDYNRLCLQYADEFSFPYFLQTAQTDENWFRGHACLRDSRTTCISNIDKDNHRCNRGIYIDIFPLDAEPVDKSCFEHKLFRLKVQTLKAICLGLAYDQQFYSRKSTIVALLLKILARMLTIGADRKEIDRKYHKLCSKYSSDTKRPVRLVSHEYKPKVRTDFRYDYSDVFTTTDHIFEKMMIPIPVNYDKCLSIAFGNYKEFPPMEKRRNNEEFIDPDHPYTDAQVLISSKKHFQDANKK